MTAPQQNDATSAMRPWYRLHLSTWLVGIIALSAAIFVVVPGELGKFSGYELAPDEARVIVHGWPAAYLWRKQCSTPSEDFGIFEPTPSLPWTLTDSACRFRLMPLALDIAVALAMVGAAVGFYEARRRKRKRAVQFSLRQLLLFATLFAVALGWWNRNRIADRDTDDAILELGGPSGAWPPRLPLWLRGIVGDEHLYWLAVNQPEKSRWSPSEAGINAIPWQPDHFDSIKRIVERFPEQVSICVDSDTVKRDLSKLRELPKLQSVFIDRVSARECRRVIAALESHPGVREVRVRGGDETASEEYLAGISKLPQLETVTTSWASTKSLAELQGCRRLRLLEIEYGDDLIEPLGRLTTVKKLKLGLDLTNYNRADISGLLALNALEELDLSESSIPDDLARGLVFPRLEYLNIASRFIGDTALAKLLGSGSLPRLKWLRIDETQLRDRSDELASVFAKLPALQTVEVQDQTQPLQPSRDILKLRNSLPRLEIIVNPQPGFLGGSFSLTPQPASIGRG